MHELPATPTAADDRDQFGRPKAALGFGQLLAVTAYWLAITVLWGAFTFSVIPRLVESDGVLGSSTHPLAGLAIGVITTAGVLIAIVVQPAMGAISDHTRSRLGRRKPYIIAGTLMDIVFLTFAAWAFWNEAYWAFVGPSSCCSSPATSRRGPYQGYIPIWCPVARSASPRGCWERPTSRATCSGPAGDPVRGRPAHGARLPGDHAGPVRGDRRHRADHHAHHRPVRAGPSRPPTTLTLKERALSAWGTDLLAQRDYVWLLVSRLFVLTALVSLQAFAVFFLRTPTTWRRKAQTAQFPLIVTVAVAALLSAIPGGWISSRIGRKPVLYVAIGLGVVGAVVIATAPSYWMVVAAAVPIGICSGVFLGVDWALMTDIIPKAESGRYMGISSIAVAGAGPIAATVGGVAVFLASLVAESRPRLSRHLRADGGRAGDRRLGSATSDRARSRRLHRGRAGYVAGVTPPAEARPAQAGRYPARWSSTGAIGPSGGRAILRTAAVPGARGG